MNRILNIVLPVGILSSVAFLVGWAGYLIATVG